MTAEPLDLTSGSLVGRVREIEASRVTVEVNDPACLARVMCSTSFPFPPGSTGSA